MSVKTTEQVGIVWGDLGGNSVWESYLDPRIVCGSNTSQQSLVCFHPQAERAILDGADYLGCGACFATGTKDTAVIGLEGLAAVCRCAVLLGVS